MAQGAHQCDIMWLILFAGVMDVVFGLHPVRKAADLRQIEALRYE